MGIFKAKRIFFVGIKSIYLYSIRCLNFFLFYLVKSMSELPTFDTVQNRSICRLKQIPNKKSLQIDRTTEEKKNRPNVWMFPSKHLFTSKEKWSKVSLENILRYSHHFMPVKMAPITIFCFIVLYRVLQSCRVRMKVKFRGRIIWMRERRD